MSPGEFMAMLDLRLSDGGIYPTLDDYGAALAALEQRDRLADGRVDHAAAAVAAVPLIRVPATATGVNSSDQIKKCVECRHAAQDKYNTTVCQSPQQRDWRDRAGADNYFMVSSVRSTECHGAWWEPKFSDVADAVRFERQRLVFYANEVPLNVEPGVLEMKFPLLPSTAPPPIHPLPISSFKSLVLRRCYWLEMKTAGQDWYRTDQRFTEPGQADEAAASLRRYQPHIQVRIVPTEEPL